MTKEFTQAIFCVAVGVLFLFAGTTSIFLQSSLSAPHVVLIGVTSVNMTTKPEGSWNIERLDDVAKFAHLRANQLMMAVVYKV